MRWIESLGEWLDRRLQLSGVIRETALHRVPRSSASWWYVFGSAALAVFILQVVTGILLPSLCALGRRGLEQPSGAQPRPRTGLVLARHARMGSNFMVALVLIT